MPDVSRLPLRMDCGGIDLTHPIDRMPPGSFPYLFNARILQEGRIDGRPGYTRIISVPHEPNSIRRLNDPAHLRAPAGYIYVGGVGGDLYAGTEINYTGVDSGYSNDPLSLIPFRPDQSPESWMYVYDKNKSVKVRPDKVVRDIGVAPPSVEPLIEYGVPAVVEINGGQSATGWTATGGSSSPTTQDRTNSSTPTITHILYRSGTTGWCCINPAISQPFWMGERMQVILSGGSETVVVRNILNAVTTTTVHAIQYDVGTTGPCSLVLTGSPVGLERNSLIQIDSEIVIVDAVIPSPNGIEYSVRCTTTGAHLAGAAVTGLISWYVYTVGTHAAGESITSDYVGVSHAASGIGAIQFTGGINASVAGGRPVDQANDLMHIAIFLQNPQNVTNIQLLLSLDPTPNFSFTNPGNSLIFTLTQDQLKTQGSSGDSWVDVVIPISIAVRSGSDLTRNLSTISGMAIQMTSTGACAYGFDWWYLFGTYGEVIQPNSPVGVVYQSRFRDSSTGARSVPGPQNRYQLFPLREAVIITPATSTQAGVDTIDIYRQGGSVTTPLYVSSVLNNTVTPNSLLDALPDSTILATNQAPELNVLQPWPILNPPWSGTCLVIGTTVVRFTGTPFDLNLLSNTVILINGVAFQTYGQPRTDNLLELTQDAGYQANVTFQVASPTLAAQPLPFAFGPLEGPFAPVVFALGDPINGGLLYFSNFSDADSSGDTNTSEVSPPSSDLVSGAVWNGLCFAGTKDQVFCVRYSYLTSIGASNNTTYQWSKVPSPSGMWSRWSCCFCPIGVAFLGRDGIYIATENGAVNISDERLYPLFPHDGQPARAVNSGSNLILPVDMSRLTDLRLSYCDEELRFSYFDTDGNANTLIYEIYRKRWLLNFYQDAINYHYLVEGDTEAPTSQQILMLSVNTNEIMLAGGNQDNGKDFDTIVLTPSLDLGDERTQKLFVDSMTQADGTGIMALAAAYDNAQSFSPVINISCTGSIQQNLQNLASLADLSLHRNIGAKFAWTGGPDGPRLYAWEMSAFLQPYLTQFFVTQFFPFSFPGWKHMRRMFPAYISNFDILLTIKCQDGRTFGPYTLPSSNGTYRIIPQMLDSGIKDLAFALQLDGQGKSFAFFPNDFTVETKQWNEETYINLAVFKA